jgi:hypothetical protein
MYAPLVRLIRGGSYARVTGFRVPAAERGDDVAMTVCPVCRTKDLAPHCRPTKDGVPQHPTCRWIRCRTCDTILDIANLRGIDHKLRPIQIR